MKVAEVVQEYWNKEGAKAYDSIHKTTKKMRNTLLSYLNVGNNGIILDFGTGTGSLALILAESGYKRIIGLDINNHMLNVAGEKLSEYPVKLVRSDGLHLALADNSVDAVVSRWVFWVMPDPEKALEEIVRVTKPGGQIISFLSGNSEEKGNSVWKKLMNFPLRRGRLFYTTLRFRLPLFRTKKFYRETKGRLPGHSPEEYVQIFKQKGLEFIELTGKEDYGGMAARIFSNSSKLSMIKGIKSGKSANQFNSCTSEELGFDDFLSVLVCPDCRYKLVKIEDNNLACKRCNRTFPIVRGIPDLLPTEDKLL